MKIVVIGAGAMGLRYGVLLQEAGNEVDFVEPWLPSYETIQAQGGVYVSRDHQKRHLVPANVFLPDAYTETPDLAILSTEVDYINGHIVKTAKKHGLDAKNHELLVDLLHLAEHSKQNGRHEA